MPHCPPHLPSLLAADWLAQNGPKGSIAREAKSIEEAKAKWKKDYKLEPGESLVLQPKTVTREAAVEFYEKMREFPNVANRVAPQKPPPYEQTGFRETHRSPPPRPFFFLLSLSPLRFLCYFLAQLPLVI